MSSSYLIGINKKYKGEYIQEYSNSWLFTPAIWNVLESKYLEPNEWGQIPHIISFFSKRNVWAEVNTLMNNSENTDERICWELTNQNLFYTKDKKIIADSIKKFVKTHKEYGENDRETGKKTCMLKANHIVKRFNQIAKDIQNIDEKKYQYFIFKNTDVDGSIECWFEDDKTLKDIEEKKVEFVNIEDSKIVGFTDAYKKFKE